MTSPRGSAGSGSDDRVVPDNRITNIDIRQGPLMRALGISNLAVQTPG